MAAALIGGAFLGSLFQELLGVVRDVSVKAVMFKSILESLESLLNRITPIFEDIERLDKLLERPENETKIFHNQLEKGLKLVRKCEKITWWNCVVKRPLYAKKLEGLKDSLLEFFQIDVQLQTARDGRKVLVTISEVGSKLDRLGTMVGGTEGFVGCCGAPGAPEFVVGLDEPLRDLKREVIEGKEKVVVVSAPGGCGKTTLAEMICQDKDIAGKFKGNIFFVTFSKTPNIMVIIKNMFHHKGIYMPEFQSEEEAFNQLEQMLRHNGSKPGLIVMDDVWPGSDSYIEEFQNHIPDYKILVTSRYVFPRFSSHKMKLLNDQDAMILFRHSAFSQDGSSRISVDIVNKMVKGCGGFPLALKVVGRSLCGQAEVMWKRRLKQWSLGESIFLSNKELLICLQSSIDALDNTVKDCFLDLASFPEDHKIPVTTLVDMWAELYDLDDDVEDALAYLYELSYLNLLNLVLARKATDENDEYYNDGFVTQHDILRELAIHHNGQSCINQRDRLIVEVKGNDFPKRLIELCQQPIYARLVSISTDGPISNWCNMELPNVKVLVLNIKAKNDYTLPHFMENISHLKTLIITNNDLSSAEISNFSLLGHLQKLKRIRLEHISITSFADSILQMRSLRKLSLIMCKVDEACNESIFQAPDMPNLVELVIDYCSDLEELPTWLCHISSLEKVSITNCHDLISLSEEFGNLENLELLRLNSCTNLLELPESIGNLRKLDFLDLSDCISLTSLPERMGELCSLQKLNMRGCGGLSELPESIKELTHLKSLICDHETAYLWEEFKIYLPDLKIDVIKEVPNLDWLQ